jgi:hypothetical protein
MEGLRSFRINNFAVIDFLGVIAVAEVILYIKGGEHSMKQRIAYYLFIFLLGIIVHDILGIKTQISLD